MSNHQIPPSSKEAEESLLGCLLIGSKYIEEAISILSPDMFYYKENGDIMRAIIDTHTAGKPVDITTITSAMRAKRSDSSIAVRIMELSSVVVTDANASAYAQIIIQKYINREAILKSSQIQEAAYEDDVDKVISLSSGIADSLLSYVPGSSFETIQQILAANINDIDRRSSSKEKKLFIDCGIHEIDRVIGGFDPGALVVIGGRSSMGKTSFALQIAYNMSLFMPVVFFSIEMTRAEIGMRYLVMLTDIDIVRLKRADNLTAQEWQLMERANTEMESHMLTIDDTPGLSIYNLRSKVYKIVQNKGVKVVFIDYLQIMGGERGKDGTEYYGSISIACKQLAKELKIVIVLLSQLNRDIEKRGEKIPRLHDLRSSGSIEQDADIVIFPVRCSRAEINDPQRGLDDSKAIISIAKNRNGQTDNVIINVSSNAAKWWSPIDEFHGPTTPVAPHYLDKID